MLKWIFNINMLPTVFLFNCDRIPLFQHIFFNRKIISAYWFTLLVFTAWCLICWVLWWHEIFETWSLLHDDNHKHNFWWPNWYNLSFYIVFLLLTLFIELYWLYQQMFGIGLDSMNYLSVVLYPSNHDDLACFILFQILYRWTFLRPWRPTAGTRSAGSTLHKVTQYKKGKNSLSA